MTLPSLPHVEMLSGTRTGRLSRQAYLDWIPHLWSILTEDIATMGPRPDAREGDEYSELGARSGRNRRVVESGTPDLAWARGSSGCDLGTERRHGVERLTRQSSWVDSKTAVGRLWKVDQDAVESGIESKERDR